MDYKTALKQVQASKKTKCNYVVVTLAYDTKLVLPHADGIALLNSLASAEQLMEPYKEQHRIVELEKDRIKVTTLSSEEYERYKIAALLGISPEEVKEAARMPEKSHD